MLIKRLYLRNFRVYEDELDLDLPSGLVGIYGPNGAGKSTLLEAILFTLWGKARTTKDLIRSSGVGGDCVTEVEFEHEGHLYLVRRTLKGVNSQVSVEAHCDGLLLSTGTRDAERYIESVLGMDDGAFRASVFTEQKQLAAFSNQTPAERRRLVLQLLGVTPLDTARDAARRDARQLGADHDRLRAMLPDLDALATEAEDAAAAADAAGITASEEAVAAQAAQERLEAAARTFQELDGRRQAYDALVIEGRAAAKRAERIEADVKAKQAQLADLHSLQDRLAGLEAEAEGLESDEAALPLLVAAAEASAHLAAVPAPEAPAVPDHDAARAAAEVEESLRRDQAAVSALVRAAEGDVERARRAVDQSAALSGGAECPTCGQELGEAFANVQAHRADELAQAERRRSGHADELARLGAVAAEAGVRAKQAASAAVAAAEAFARWERAAEQAERAAAAWEQAWAAALGAGAGRWLSPPLSYRLAAPPDGAALESARRRAETDVAAKRRARSEALTVAGRLAGRDAVEKARADLSVELVEATGEVDNLRQKVKALDYRPTDLQAAAEGREKATGTAAAAAQAAHQAAIGAARARERAAGAATRLADAADQHGRLAAIESDVRHRSRAAELLAEFRNTVVSSVGPRLALQAAELFGELTDHEYERIEVDPDNYQLQISDGGRLYGLDRFSGSEIDLANLALRVAISEHIHFQSGGSVGLLVLDEVFGPLDEDRKTRMLLALERLRGRFRQVLVVTHDSEIKDQMPNAIEVVKRPGRRATARVLGD